MGRYRKDTQIPRQAEAGQGRRDQEKDGVLLDAGLARKIRRGAPQRCTCSPPRARPAVAQRSESERFTKMRTASRISAHDPGQGCRYSNRQDCNDAKRRHPRHAHSDYRWRSRHSHDPSSSGPEHTQSGHCPGYADPPEPRRRRLGSRRARSVPDDAASVSAHALDHGQGRRCVARRLARGDEPLQQVCAHLRKVLLAQWPVP